MSASEQSRSPSRTTGPSSIRRIRRRRRQERLWFGVSLGLHGIVLAALIYLTPVRELVSQVIAQPVRPEATMSSNVLMDVAQAIDQHAAEQIKENTQELHNVLADMSDIQAKMSLQFSAFAEQQTNTAVADAAEDMRQAIEQMQNAAASIGRDNSIEETDRYQALAEQAQGRASTKLAMAPFDVKAAAEAQQHAEDAHQQAKAAHDQDRTLKEQLPVREAALKREQAASDQRKQEVEKAVQRKQELQEPKQQEKQQAEIDRLTTAAEAQDKKTTDAQAALTQAQAQQNQAHQDAQNKQQQAVQTQKDALAALQSAIEQHKTQTAALAAAQQTGAAQAQPEQPPAPSPQATGPQEPLDVPALYDAARGAESNIAETLKDIRAMDLAMVRDIKLQDARSDIDVVRPVRPDLDASLLREDVRTGQLLEAHKAELRKALRESNSMVNLAHRMLEMANQSVAKMKFGTDVSMADYTPPEPPDFELIIRELAMEDVAGRISDVSGAMTAAEQMMQGQGGQGGAAAQRMQDIKDLTQDVQGDRTLMSMGVGEGEGPFPKLAPDARGVAARKLEPGGIPTQLMSIDSWYTIGPFPNPNRVNIDREFPPDSLIDLDATYTGKGGRTIRWKFVQSDKNEMVPGDPDQYGIWYAYTEFYCDKPRDVWIAAGTDDRGTLKINGVPVWISSKRLKGWTIDEVWRKVHFSKGVNRILYRVENGWMNIGFSLVLKLDDQ